MADAASLPVHTLAENRRSQRILLAQVGVFVIGATSSLQVANVTATLLSVVCLLLMPGFLLMSHRGVDLVPLVLAALGWISYLASCVVNGVSVLWPNAVAPAALRRRSGAGGVCAQRLRAVKNRIRTSVVVFIWRLRLWISNWPARIFGNWRRAGCWH